MKKLAFCLIAIICSIHNAGAQDSVSDTKTSALPYDFIGEYGNLGMALVQSGGKYGFIDEEGAEIIPLQYDKVGIDVWDFYATYISVCLNGHWGLIDQQGNRVIKPEYDQIRPFLFEDETLVWAKKKDKYGCLDISGKVIIPFEYKDLQNSFWEGQPTFAQKNGKYGFIDRNNQVLIPFKYSSTQGFGIFSDLAPVSIKEKYGYIDKTGREAIPLQYEYADTFFSGLAAVVKNGKVGFIDESGTLVIPFQFDAEYISDQNGKTLKDSYFTEQAGLVILNGKRGLIDRSGNILIPCIYDECETIDEWEGIIDLKKDGLIYYFDLSGTQYDSEAERVVKKDYNLANKNFSYNQLHLAQKYLADGDYEKAIYWFRKSSEGGYSIATAGLGVLYLSGETELGQSDQAAYELFSKANAQKMSSLYKYAMGADHGFVYDVKRILFNSSFGISESFLGDMFFMGSDATPKSYELAFSWYSKAASLSSIDPEFTAGIHTKLGKMYCSGNGVEQSYEKGARWLSLAKKYDTEAQARLGLLYYEGNGVEQSFEKAFRWLTKAAENGNKLALGVLGDMFFFGEGVEESDTKAFEFYSEYLNYYEDIPIQRRLGMMYSKGWGVETSYEKAYEWFLKASEQGDAASQYELSTLVMDNKIQGDHGTAFHWLMSAAEKNYGPAQYRLGQIFTINKSTAEAYEWFLKAAENDNSNAQYMLGEMYYNGTGVPQSFQRAFDWYLKAAENNNVGAQGALGEMYYNGTGVEKSNEKALYWFEKATNIFSPAPRAYMGLGRMYYRGDGVQQSYEIAYKWFIKACDTIEQDETFRNVDNRYDEVYRYLGLMHFFGYGVDQSYEKAYRWFSSAEDPVALYYLGVMREKGYYTPQSYAGAADYYTHACAKNNPDAYQALGYLYYQGYGVPQSYAKAFELFSKAADAGNVYAQYNIGVLYNNGTGVPYSMEKAFEWYLKAANNNYEPGMSKVAQMYENGQGVRPNVEEAKKWYSKSAAAGNLVSKEKLQLLQKSDAPIQPTLATLSWIRIDAVENSNELDLKIGINSNCKVENVGIYLDDVFMQGWNYVVDEHYDMAITKRLAMHDGPNLIRVNVTNAAGTATTERLVVYQDRNAPLIDWLVSDNSSRDRQFTIKIGIKSNSQIEYCNIFLNNNIVESPSGRGIHVVKDDGYASNFEKNILLDEGQNTIRIEVKNAGGVSTLEKNVIYTPQKWTSRVEERRFALVIGNSNYSDVDKRLKNPSNDATDLANKLRQLGFRVITKTDLNHREMLDAINEFENICRNSDVALFFYAGHGITFEGENYMIPTNAYLQSENDIPGTCIGIERVQRAMNSARMKIIMLDACRNNPFTRGWSRGISDYDGFNIVFPEGIFVSYATRKGDVAIDGVAGERNSPYTSAVLQVLDIPNLKLHDFFIEVRAIVSEKTSGRQKPAMNDDMDGVFIFNRK